ncbi:tripartite tricarboxylate transporter substrate-binding protein [Methylopila sp. M107]|uniref:Bug family tripartite tricarboxylate transporter substrate binding protein n=1 Tax=Methylopila sp. M107 TaxID=1101190 RepID=UPI0003630198|nr:tripartite tricarboxylate transporter substrate-binding protein [Methylopila sp. M107]
MQNLLRGAICALALTVAVPAASAASLKITAPAAPGGGWDQTARAMQMVLQTEKLATGVQVENVPGAGGTIGLAQFALRSKGDPNALIVGGFVMVGAIITNKAPVTLDQVTPIARLTGEYEAIVVNADSPVKSIADIVTMLKANPGSVSWGGGSAGGTDHITAGLIAKAAGVDPTKVNYIAYSGGGESMAAILGGKTTVGVAGYGEFDSQVKAGKLRVLAISAPERVAGIDAPTLKESGLDVVIQNWRMVAAPAGLKPDKKAELVKTIAAMAKSQAWQDQLKAKGWTDTFLEGDAFEAQLKSDIAKTEAILKEIGLAK